MAASGPNGSHNESMVRGPGVTTGRSGVLGKVFYVHDDFWPLNTSLWVKEFKLSTPAYAFHLLRRLDFAVFNACNPVHLKRIGANAVGCFNGDYAVCRGWGALVYLAPEKVDGILFPSARSGGKKNLALFGGRVLPADVEFKEPGTALLADPGISELLVTESIGWI